MPCPYTTAGTRPDARILRATPLPAPSRRSAFSFCSIGHRLYRANEPAALELVLALEDLGDGLVLEHGVQRRGDDRGDRQDGEPIPHDLGLLLGNGKGVRHDGRL